MIRLDPPPLPRPWPTHCHSMNPHRFEAGVDSTGGHVVNRPQTRGLAAQDLSRFGLRRAGEGGKELISPGELPPAVYTHDVDRVRFRRHQPERSRLPTARPGIGRDFCSWILACIRPHAMDYLPTEPKKKKKKKKKERASDPPWSHHSWRLAGLASRSETPSPPSL